MIINSAAMQSRSAGAVRAVGTSCTFTRIVGVAPNAIVTTAAGVMAVVKNSKADDLEGRREGYAIVRPGGMQFSDRAIIVVAADLAIFGAPPLQKGDRLVVAATGDRLEITEVDLMKRVVSGVIEAIAVGL